MVNSYKLHGFEWIDILKPTSEELKSISENYNLPASAFKDCLQPQHLPKFEAFGDLHYIILRAFDYNSAYEADTIEELTNKIAVFYSEKFIITIHLHEFKFIHIVKEKYFDCGHCQNTYELLGRIMKGVLISFEEPTRNLSAEFDTLESDIFLSIKTPDLLKNLYLTKRKAASFTTVLNLSKSIIENLKEKLEPSIHQDLVEIHIYITTICDPIREGVPNLLNIYLLLASQKTSEVMRLLTIFSAFFLPLTFIVGVYGMNFDIMPELRVKYGYPGVLSFMAIVTIAIFAWFRRKKWL